MTFKEFFNLRDHKPSGKMMPRIEPMKMLGGKPESRNPSFRIRPVAGGMAGRRFSDRFDAIPDKPSQVLPRK